MLATGSEFHAVQDTFNEPKHQIAPLKVADAFPCPHGIEWHTEVLQQLLDAVIGAKWQLFTCAEQCLKGNSFEARHQLKMAAAPQIHICVMAYGFSVRNT